jgi:hypothetical protein
MERPYGRLEDWAGAFEQAVQELLRERGAGAGQDGYQVAAVGCERHGPGCAAVTYGMFREHLRWAVESPRQLAERAMGTMLPAERPDG